MGQEFCLDCGKRGVCAEICPELELHLKRDIEVPQRERTIGLPRYGKMPNRLANITPKVHLSNQQIDRIIRTLKTYKRKRANLNY